MTELTRRRIPIGVNTWVWLSPLSDDRLAALAPRVRGWGFDVIELPLEHPDDWDPIKAAALLTDLGLGATICAVMPPERDLVSDDPATVATTQEYLRRCVDAAATVGSSVVAGPIYSAVGRTWLIDAPTRAVTIDRLVEALWPVAAYAEGHGVRLAIEPLNRFETSLINTTAQALEVVNRLGSPACGLLLDTFHMNIEEQHLGAAIRAAGPHLVHVHACANDRGAPGADHLDWVAIAAALTEINYQGAVCIESFTTDNRAMATAASIWRPLASSQDALAIEGLAFLRQLLG